ncbi:MAG: NAD+ synthase [Ignavibacteria bacterium]|nr:NAD+ synthase [Ignavibacteria bacterium]
MEPNPSRQLDLRLDTAIVRTILVDFLRDGVRAAGFSRGIIGLSGGVDSSLSASLAAEALGPENVLGVIMPSGSSSPQSRTDAELVASKLGIRSETIEIAPMVEAHRARGADPDKVRLGNIMARERMIVLYDLSIREKALVIGTSNKTETLLGYGTLFGDTACALNPLGDLYKTQVWELAAAVGIPEQIVTKAPSADLWEGQTDESELGFSYKQVDSLLYSMIDQGKSDRELLELGFGQDFIQAVQKRIRTNQFKRRSPLVARISGSTPDIDFKYPKEWGS